MTDQFETIFKGILTIYEELEEIVRNQVDREKLCEVQLFDYEYGSELRNEFIGKRDEMIRARKGYIFFGDTSSGKSTTINALLKNNILPMSSGHTTRCFMEILPTIELNNYFTIDNDNKQQNIELLNSINKNSSMESNIKIYINNKFIPILKDKTILIDSPGKDSRIEGNLNFDKKLNVPMIEENNEEILELCKNSEVRILVVNGTGWINDSTMRFINEFKRKFEILNLLIVFTNMENVHRDCETSEEKNNRENILKKKALEILKDKEGNADKNDINNIFFLSPLEHLKIINGFETNEPKFVQDREKDFERFRNALEDKMNHNFYSMRIKSLFSVFLKLIQNYSSLLSEMKSKTFQTKFANILKITEEVDKIIMKQNLLEKLWGVKLLNLEKSKELMKEMSEKIYEIKEETESKIKRFIFFGDTLSGKSTTINALLKRNILPISFGQTTKCFLEILANDNLEEYLQIDNDIIHQNIESLQSINENSPSRSIIRIHLNNILRDTILIDTPGKDAGIETSQNRDIIKHEKIQINDNKTEVKNEIQSIDDEILEKCKKAEVRILIVKGDSWISDSTLNFIDQFKNHFVKLNLFVVFTYMDNVHRDCENPEDKINKENTLKDKAIKLFKDKEGKLDKTDIINIFFLSPSEHLKIINGTSTNEPIFYQDREKEFERFRIALEEQMKDDFYNRRIENIYAIFFPFINDIKSLLSDIKSGMCSIPCISHPMFYQITNVMKDSDVKKIISKAYKQIYKEFIQEGIILIKKKTENVKSDLHENEEGNNCNDETEALIVKIKTKKIKQVKNIKQIKHDNIMNLLNKKIGEMKDKIKTEITNIIIDYNDEYYLYRFMVLEKIFYPLYIDKVIIDHIDDLEKLFIKINTVLFGCVIAAGIGCGLILVIPCIVTAGAAIPIAAATEAAIITIVASSLAAGAAGGGIVGGGIATICNKNKHKFIRKVWEEDEDIIKIPVDKVPIAAATETDINTVDASSLAAGATGDDIAGISRLCNKNKHNYFRKYFEEDEHIIKIPFDKFVEEINNCFDNFKKDLESNLEFFYTTVENDFVEIEKNCSLLKSEDLITTFENDLNNIKMKFYDLMEENLVIN